MSSGNTSKDFLDKVGNLYISTFLKDNRYESYIYSLSYSTKLWKGDPISENDNSYEIAKTHHLQIIEKIKTTLYKNTF